MFNLFTVLSLLVTHGLLKNQPGIMENKSILYTCKLIKTVQNRLCVLKPHHYGITNYLVKISQRLIDVNQILVKILIEKLSSIEL